MNKWIVTVVVLLGISCQSQGVNQNILDPSSSLGLTLQLGIGNSLPFECNMNPSDLQQISSLVQVDLDCNLPLDRKDWIENFKRFNPNFPLKELVWRTESNVSLLTEAISEDQSVPINLRSILSTTGRSLINNERQIIISNQLPNLELVDYSPVLDYSFLSNKYWDLEINEPINGLGIPTLSGSLASNIRIRSLSQINSKKFRLFFETINLSNVSGNLTVSFNSGKDSAGNPLQKMFQIQFIGLVPGPSLSIGRLIPFVFSLQNGSLVVLNGRSTLSPNRPEILKAGETEFQRLNSNLANNIIGETATLMSDQSIFIVGGQNSENSLSSTAIQSQAFVFNPSLDTVTTVAALPQPRTFHSATLLNNGKVLVAGGISSFATFPFPAINTTVLFDPNTQAFTSGPNMGGARSHHCAIRLLDGRVWMAGGFSRYTNAMLDSTEFYDPATNSFSAGPFLPGQNALFNCTLLSDGNVIISPGVEILSSNAMFLFDVKANRVFSLPSLRFGRMATAVAVWQKDSFIMFGGGATNVANQATRTIEKFDYGKSEVFQDLGSDLEPRTFLSPVRLSNGSLFLIGGQEADGTSSQKSFFYGSRPSSN